MSPIVERLRLRSAVVTTLLALGAALWVQIIGSKADLAFALGFCLMVLLSVLGLFLVRRVPDNAVSWVFLGAVVATTISQTASTWFNELIPGAAGAFVAHNVLLWISLGLMGFLILLFPTGRPPSPRWTWALWMGGLGSISQVVRPVYLAVDLPLADLRDGPTGSSFVDALSLVGQAAVVTAVVASLIGFFVRYHRAAGVEKLQMKYLVPSFTFLAGFWVIESLREETTLAILLLGLGAVTFPIAIVLSITRYRLYDIERIVSRTVSYLAVAVLLGSLFAIGVVAIPNLVIGDGAAPPLAVAASTLVVAALFNPLRKRIQGWVDRRFNRSRYDVERVMGLFADSLRDQSGTESLIDGWVSVVSHTMQPSSVGVWLRE
jgi:hypothetical protein